MTKFDTLYEQVVGEAYSNIPGRLRKRVGIMDMSDSTNPIKIVPKSKTIRLDIEVSSDAVPFKGKTVYMSTEDDSVFYVDVDDRRIVSVLKAFAKEGQISDYDLDPGSDDFKEPRGRSKFECEAGSEPAGADY